MSDLPDNDLLEQYRNGNRENAFEQIVNKYQRQLYRHIRHIVQDHDDTHDVLQNTLIKAWNGLSTFRAEAQLYTWLYRIATNEALSFIRKQRKNQMVPVDQATYYLVDEDSSPGDTMLVMQRKLLEAISQLPEKQRLVFSLKYFEEMKYEEMAAILDTSVGALKASFHHAVKKIEDHIKSD